MRVTASSAAPLLPELPAAALAPPSLAAPQLVLQLVSFDTASLRLDDIIGGDSATAADAEPAAAPEATTSEAVLAVAALPTCRSSAAPLLLLFLLLLLLLADMVGLFLGRSRFVHFLEGRRERTEVSI